MTMRIGRTLPPAAAPLQFKNVLSGFAGVFGGTKTIRVFEEELKGFYGVRRSFTVSSGRAALVLVLQALKEISPERDEVLIPAYTCYSVPSAIVRAGLKVRLCDLASGSLDFDIEQLEQQADNPRLLSVLPTHLFGLPANVERIKGLFNDRGVLIVEDAAQAMGGVKGGSKLGTLGDVGIFSLSRGKAFSTMEGGIILTDNEVIGRAIEKQIVAISEYGCLDFFKLIFSTIALTVLIHPLIYWLPKSLPFLKLGETHFEPSFPVLRMSSFQAGMAKGWKLRIAELTTDRLNNAQEFATYGLVIPGLSEDEIPSLIRFPFLTESPEAKSRILKFSDKKGQGVSAIYPGSIDEIEELKKSFAGKCFPVAKDLASRLISLPVHSFVSKRDIRNIIESLKS